jgi:hypothetical protein
MTGLPTISRTAGMSAPADALHALDRRLEEAQCALGSDDSGSKRDEAATLLHEVEVRLVELATAAPDTTVAKGLISLRDSLSSHLLAASTCELGELPTSVVVRLLRRGADQTRRGIRRTVTASR